MRTRRPKITKAELEQVAMLARLLNFDVSAIELTATYLRLSNGRGQALTAGADQENLDTELAEHRARNGYGAP
jgi:hypothetical protein